MLHFERFSMPVSIMRCLDRLTSLRLNSIPISLGREQDAFAVYKENHPEPGLSKPGRTWRCLQGLRWPEVEDGSRRPGAAFQALGFGTLTLSYEARVRSEDRGL